MPRARDHLEAAITSDRTESELGQLARYLQELDDVREGSDPEYGSRCGERRSCEQRQLRGTDRMGGDCVPTSAKEPYLLTVKLHGKIEPRDQRRIEEADDLLHIAV